MNGVKVINVVKNLCNSEKSSNFAPQMQNSIKIINNLIKNSKQNDYRTGKRRREH